MHRTADDPLLIAALCCGVAIGACNDRDAARDAGREPDATSPARSDAAGTPEDVDDAGGGDASSEEDVFVWSLPAGFPQPLVPADNPMSNAKVELGRRLFYDVRLSGNRTYACATCHVQAKAFTDGRALGLGSTGEEHSRSAMSLANVGYASTLTWANPLMLELERQAVVPEFGDSPFELALDSQDELEQRLRDDRAYAALFADAFPADAEPITAQNTNRAIASFERVLISGRSPFDRWLNDGDENAISASARRGYDLFNSEQLECFHCHGGFAFTDHAKWQGKPSFDAPYHNTGLYNLDRAGSYPEPNTGVNAVTLDPRDMGMFKAPTLRNIAVTAPYMHDGSIATLSEVLDHYADGGRAIASGPNQGDGSRNPLKDPLVSGFELSAEQRADMLAFLESLTDAEFLTDPAFSDPFAIEEDEP